MTGHTEATGTGRDALAAVQFTQPHHDPAVCRLIAEAREQGRQEAAEAIFELAKKRAVLRRQKGDRNPLMWTVTIANLPRLIREALASL